MVLRIEVAAETSVGMKRTDNEDKFGVLEAHGVYVVADGMGGHSSGEVASGLAVQAMREHYDATPFGRGRAEEQSRMVAAVLHANQRIFATAAQEPRLRGMGTTVVAAAARGEGVHVAHVGDSRAYRVRRRGIEQLTEDHSLVNELLRAGRVRPEEVAAFAKKNLVTRALGLKSSVAVETRYEDMREGDVLLLCTDGLSGVVPDESILDVVNTSASMREAASTLVSEANARGGPDNVTVMLLKWTAA